MAQDDKKKSNGGGHPASGKKGGAPEAAAEAREAEAPERGEAGHGHGHKPNIKEYFVIFGVLFALTVLEVAVAQIPGIGKTALAVALIGLALTKAACVGLYYMHLKQETKYLRLVVAFPMAFPAIYALVLIGEAAWRMVR